MTRLERAARLVAALVVAACSPPLQRKPLEMQPIGTVPNISRTPADDPSNTSSVTTPNSRTPEPRDPSAGPCGGSDIDLDEALRRCEAPMPKASEAPSGLKDKLEVRVTSPTNSILPGGRLDLTVSLRNKSSDALVVYFTGDPAPRFEVEASDAKGRRGDTPPGKAPPWPKGTGPQTREVKAAKITLDKGGIAHVRITWDAVKVKWAPDLAKTWDGRGYPRGPAGPLPAGRYKLTVKMPVVGIESVEIPKLPIDVGSRDPPVDLR